jgi:hypothetical protein
LHSAIERKQSIRSTAANLFPTMVAAIYFEKQINGETDCGMRAVNNLLQRPAYNRDTFAALAREFK